MREKLFNRANRESRYTAARNAPKARAENSSIFFRMVICGICGDRGILGRANRGSFTCLYRKFEKNLSPSKPLGAQLALQSRGDDERNYDSIGNRMHREVKRASRNFSNRAEGPRPPRGIVARFPQLSLSNECSCKTFQQLPRGIHARDLR